MGRCRIVAPASVRVPMSGGDFLTVKKELNAGEYVDLLTEHAAGKFFAKPIAYLVGWSFCGANETPIPYDVTMSADDRRDTLRSLDTATMVEIVAAIEAHETQLEATIADQKKMELTGVAS
jgi:hypothetical protein